MSYKIFEYDPYLLPYQEDVELRMAEYEKKKRELLQGGQSLLDFANAHEYFGFHKLGEDWVYREWAPGADAVYLVGDFNGWEYPGMAMSRLDRGVFELYLKDERRLYHGCKVKTVVEKQGVRREHIPLYARRVVQDSVTGLWAAQISDEAPYEWRAKAPKRPEHPLIYECHIGMAQDKEAVGTYLEFRDLILPRIKALGYNTIQIMAIMEHPYYGSFGYQVSSFYAASSRYGTEKELKSLIDRAHEMGLYVLLDVIHSHAVKNVAEGINLFDGTEDQFFHQGDRGNHPAWDTKLFNYGKNEVIHFLLSNLKFWLNEYHFDGFRFDGITSMIYHDHGLGRSFDGYHAYFSMNTHLEAITYLQLANELIRRVNPRALTIAEDMSGMPGMCLPVEEGGIGFDYRLSMGVPDMWIRLLKTQADEQWNVRYLWHELTSRRPKEKSISYVESHDQALVGDKTVMFRLCDSEMYTGMERGNQSPIIMRGLALHEMLRLLTITLGGEGYLNFMGNEFGHPEWIDFPREGNGWSHWYCRRQWHLVDDPTLHYCELQEFDRAMLRTVTQNNVLGTPTVSLYIDEEKQILLYERGNLVFAFNFSPHRSYDGYLLRNVRKGTYQPLLSTDETRFGGYGRVGMDVEYKSFKQGDGTFGFPIYLPSRSALCLKRTR